MPVSHCSFRFRIHCLKISNSVEPTGGGSAGSSAILPDPWDAGDLDPSTTRGKSTFLAPVMGAPVESRLLAACGEVRWLKGGSWAGKGLLACLSPFGLSLPCFFRNSHVPVVFLS